MQQAGEKVTGTIAATAASSGFLGFTLTGYEWANLVVAIISASGWFYFKYHEKKRADEEIIQKRLLIEKDES